MPSFEYPPAKEVARQALISEIQKILHELDYPPLVQRVWPEGWQLIGFEDMCGFYSLCVRSLAAKEREAVGK